MAKPTVQLSPVSVAKGEDRHGAGKARLRIVPAGNDVFNFDDVHYHTCRLRFAQFQYLALGLTFFRFRERFSVPVTAHASHPSATSLHDLKTKHKIDWVRLLAETLASFQSDCHSKHPKVGLTRMAKVLRRALPSLLGMSSKDASISALKDEFKAAFTTAQLQVEKAVNGKAADLLPLDQFAEAMGHIERNLEVAISGAFGCTS